jgi:aspartate beta-hydroxylase
MKSFQDDLRWGQALRADEGGQVVGAELLYSALLQAHPKESAIVRRLARLANLRGDHERAVELLRKVHRTALGDSYVALELAQSLAASGQPIEAERTLQALVDREPDHAIAWLVLGRLLDIRGEKQGALKAWYQAVVRSQRSGRWHDRESTPAQWLELVITAIERVRAGRRELFLGSYDDLRARYGASELRRVDRALTGWMRESDATPKDPRQRPRFFYFPGLPEGPFHDPMLQPWAHVLSDAFADIREEACALCSEPQTLPNFRDPPSGGRGDEYVDGSGPSPAWKAFFLYRRGLPISGNHALCPRTSSAIESVELCRIDAEAPEILFSVLASRSHIKPHHGVSNIRLVMHLPLVVPPGCLFRIVDHGDHVWQEGQLVMFDDTYLHEAWNQADRARLVLLMDCWNPHLTPVERIAMKQLVETISGLHAANTAGGDAAPTTGVMED